VKVSLRRCGLWISGFIILLVCDVVMMFSMFLGRLFLVRICVSVSIDSGVCDVGLMIIV